jgi:hypothetical protein
MNGALLRKELRDLLPWGGLAVALAVAELAFLLIGQIDMLPLGATFVMLNEGSVIFYWFVAFAIGTGLAVREQDDGTLSFLDGLPVSRTHVFLVKCAAMLALVLLAPIVRFTAIVFLHYLSRGSLDYEWHAALLLQGFALQALLMANGLMLGAALGRLRSLTWLVAGIAAVAVLIVTERTPRTAALNPMALLDWQWSATGLRVDSSAVLIQLALAAAALLIAWRGFVKAGAPRARVTDRPFVGAVVTLGTIGAAVGVLTLIVSREVAGPAGPAEQGSTAAYVFAASPPAQTQTSHYRFSYPAHQAEGALALAADADAIFERVHELLGVPVGERIDVDVSGSARNTHGTAFFGRIRMALHGEVHAVLAHETAHVVAQRHAGAARSRLWNEAAVLNEGLASWIESHYRVASARDDERMLVLAALDTRRELLVEELASPAILSTRRDEELKYTAGEALIRALLRIYGEAALPRLLGAFADVRLPSDLRGLQLWQAAFQVAGMNVAAVIDELYREVSAYADAHADRIAALPRPRVIVVRRDGGYGVVTVLDAHDEHRGSPDDERADMQDGDRGDVRDVERGNLVTGNLLVLRFRPAPDSPLTTFTQVDAVPGRVVPLAPQRIAAGRVCVQPGVRIGMHVLFEPWSCLPLSEAAPNGTIAD